MNHQPNNLRVIDVNGSTVLPSTLINCYSALSIPAYWRAMNFLADTLASFPRSVRATGEQPADFTHPLDSILRRRPNRYANPYTLWRTLYFHVAHAGNGYLRIERDPRTLRPVALHNLEPGDVSPVRYLPDGESSPLQLYVVRSLNAVLPGEDVIHLRALSWDGQSGTDPVAMHDATFQRAATIDRYQTRYLQKGSVIRGSIMIPGDATDEQIEQIRAIVSRYHAGADAERDVLVLSGGAEFSNATITPQQSQMLEQAVYTTKQIAQITGVPAEMLGEMSDARYVDNLESAGQNVVRFTLRPYIEQAEDELTLKLLTEAEQDAGLSIRLNANALLRGSTKEQSETLIAQRNAGILTANEVRDRLDLPRLADPEADRLKLLGDTTGDRPTS